MEPLAVSFSSEILSYNWQRSLISAPCFLLSLNIITPPHPPPPPTTKILPLPRASLSVGGPSGTAISGPVVPLQLAVYHQVSAFISVLHTVGSCLLARYSVSLSHIFSTSDSPSGMIPRAGSPDLRCLFLNVHLIYISKYKWFMSNFICSLTC